MTGDLGLSGSETHSAGTPPAGTCSKRASGGGGNCRLSASKPALNCSIVGSSGRGRERNLATRSWSSGLAMLLFPNETALLLCRLGDAGRDIFRHLGRDASSERIGDPLLHDRAYFFCEQPQAGLADRRRHAAEQEMAEQAAGIDALARYGKHLDDVLGRSPG